MEEKYRYRKGSRKCPECGKEAIIKENQAYIRDGHAPGWMCWRKKDGCGAMFASNDPQITGQNEGQVENTNIHDARSTVIAMSAKRAKVSAANSLSCMTEKFTDSVEETGVGGGGESPAASTSGHVPDLVPGGGRRVRTPPPQPPDTSEMEGVIDATFHTAPTDFTSAEWRDDICKNFDQAEDAATALGIHKTITPQIKAILTKDDLAACVAKWKATQARLGMTKKEPANDAGITATPA